MARVSCVRGDESVFIEIHDSEMRSEAVGCGCALERPTPSTVAFVPCEEHGEYLKAQDGRAYRDEEE